MQHDSALLLALAITLSPAGPAAAQEAFEGFEIPPGWVAVHEDYFEAFANEPSHQFHAARESLLERDFTAAARSLERAAMLMRIESDRANDEDRQEILEQADELDALAELVARGALDSAQRLSAAFARAHHVLAVHRLNRAAEARERGAPKAVGRELEAATLQLEQEAAWSDRELDAATRSALKRGREVADALLAGKPVPDDEVTAAVRTLRSRVRRFSAGDSSLNPPGATARAHATAPSSR